VELKRSKIGDGDSLLLCSDGLTDMVPETLIARELAASSPAEPACRRLIDLALDAGGKDNVTVVLGRYRIPNAAAPGGPHRH
jgi:protein phosphatase